MEKRDKYGRLLAYVYKNNTLINSEIIKQGYGHAYTKYPLKYLDEFREYERQARENGLGLWGKRDVKKEPKKARAPNQKQEETVYITNTGKKYHREFCSYLRKSKIPISKKEALNMGYTPCSRCSP